MASDLTDLQRQLLGTFFEESEESLERLEVGLLHLEPGPVDPGTINEIFRAAHSIKGAAGTFGFAVISELAHEMETLLDAFRTRTAMPTADSKALLLAGVDHLRSMLGNLRVGQDPDRASFAPLAARLRAVLPRSTATPAASPPPPEVSAAPSTATRYRIDLRPHPQMLALGNDPARLIRELERLGTTTVEADLSQLPALADLPPEECHLAWSIQLEGAPSRAEIDEVFAWVTEDADITITPMRGPDSVVSAPPTASSAPESPSARGSTRTGDADPAMASVRVGVEKIDNLMNMVGELVITQSMLGELDGDGPLDTNQVARIREGLSQLARSTRALQESVMRLRSMPVSVVFNRFPRLVHDLGHQLGKQVELEVTGQTTELDKTVLEKLGDPLVHLVRNALDHGLETPEQRRAAGKPEHGTIGLSAFHRGGDIVIEVRDDGRGLDPQKILQKARERGLVKPDETPNETEIINLIFAPGFSTAETVSDISGRGVGMDVVRRNVRSLGGEITIDSTLGRGTRISLRLPLTLAIIDGQIIRVGDHRYVIPLLAIVESLQIDPRLVKSLSGRSNIYRLRDQLVPIIELAEVLGLERAPDSADRLLVIVEGDGQRTGLVVDELLAQQQAVVKSLESNYERVPGLSGATILGDGSVAFILDAAGISRLARSGSAAPGAQAA